MKKQNYCPHCGKKLSPAEIICAGCGHFINIDEMITGDVMEPDENIRLQDMNISRYIPTPEEKIVRCKLCGGENKRGDNNCKHCGFLIKQSSVREEIINEDDEIINTIPPTKQDLYRMMGIKLYIYKLINKFSYKCQTRYQHEDGSIETCGQQLTFIHKSCPKCKEKKEIFYNCSNYDDPKIRCMQPIDMDMMICPNCGASTLLNDLKSVITGQAFDPNAVMIAKKYLQRDFPGFTLLNENYTIVISHHKLMEAKWWLQSKSKAVSEMLKMLAMFLDVVTNPRGKPSMPSIFGSFNLPRAINQVQSPQPSLGLQDLLQKRLIDMQAGNAATMQSVDVQETGEDANDLDNSELTI